MSDRVGSLRKEGARWTRICGAALLVVASSFGMHPSAAAQDREAREVADGPEHHVRAESRHGPGLRLLMRGSSSEPWDATCALPCDLRRAAGPWELAVRPDDAHDPLPLDRAISFEADGTLFLSYSSREAARIFGGILLGHGLAGLVATGVGYAETMEDPLAYLWVLPLVVSLVLTLVGPLLLTASPSASAMWIPAEE